MASRLLKTVNVVHRSPALNVIAVRMSHGAAAPVDWELEVIGNREVVGPGVNNQASYVDRPDFPCPAIRFRPSDAPGVQALREKEKGDWHSLTLAEKKALYRASFRQTLVESISPSSQWKTITGCTFGVLGLVIWIVMGLKVFVLDPLPASLSLESRQEQLMRVLDLEMEPIEGISSKYDYEKGDWKK